MDGNRFFHRVRLPRSATRSRRWAALLTAAATLAATLAVASAPQVRAAVCDTAWTGVAGDGRWTTPGNWSAGVPTSSSNACLPLGSYTVSIIGESVQAKSLTIEAGPTLSIDELNCGAISAFLTLYGDSSNAGTINLANINDACGGTAQLTIISPFTLTNTGTIATTGCCRGDRELTGSVTNKGTVNVNHNGSNLFLHLDGAGLFDNQGTVTIGDSRTLVVSGGTGLEFRNDSGGSIAGNGITGQLILNNGNTFTQSAGTTTGNPVLVNGGATLRFTGSGASTFDLRGDGGPNTISGSTIAAAQTMTINIHGCGVVSSVANLAGSMTNAGTINLGNADDGCGGTAQLVIPSGSTLTNTGTIATTGCCRGDRELTGSVTNKGTINVNHNGSNLVLHLDGAGLFDNQGTVTIQGSRTLTNTNDTVIVEPGSTLGGPGSYAQGSPATLGVTVDAVHNTFTGIFCGEAVSVDGTLQVTTLGTPTFGSTWPIISCAGGRSGTFATFNFGGTNYTVLYPPNGVTLVAPRPSDPAIRASGTTFAPTEGQSFSGKVATFTDPDTAAMSSEYSATIDWGDATGTTTGTVSGASGTFSVSGTHTYAEESTYPVTVTITDVDNSSNSATAHSTANVGDAALSSNCAMPQFTQQSYTGPTATFTDASSTGALNDFSATISWGDGPSSSGTITGGPGTAPYTVSGRHTYTSTGSFTIATTIKDVGGSSTTATCTVIVFAFPTSNQATFVIGDLEATLLNSVSWWSNQWAQLNPMSGGPAPTTMKGFSGFEDNPLGLPPACGGSWTTDTGNATPPPPSVPEFMGVIVSSKITQSGSVVSGDIKEIVIVKNNPGYAPDPGHPGTGTVVAVVCRG